MQGMIERSHRKSVEDALENQAGVVLLGPRQVGKTTLAQDIAESRDAVYLDMERTADRQVLEEPDLYLGEQVGRLVVIDEVQLVPGLFGALRGQIDRRRRQGHRTGQFLLLGSASNTLLHQSVGIAGRSRQLSRIDTIHAAGGWFGCGVGTLVAWRLSRQLSGEERSGPASHGGEEFIRTYLERDIPSFGLRIPAETLRRFWTMLAHEQGGAIERSQACGQSWCFGAKRCTVSRSACRSDAGAAIAALAFPCWKAIGQIAQGLHSGFRTDPRSSWDRSTGRLAGHPVVGGSWEGFCIENLIAAAPRGTEASFYRSSAGAEIDLVLKLPGGQIWGHGNQADDIAESHARVSHRSRRVGSLGTDPRLCDEKDVPGQGGVRAMPLMAAFERLASA